MRPLRAQAFPSAPSLILALALAAALTPASAGSLLAQTEIPQELFQNQAPLTAADAPAAVEFMQRQEQGAMDLDAIVELAGKHRMTPERLFFVSAKFMCGILLLPPSPMSREDVSAQMGSPLALPDETELEVIRTALEQAPDIR
ncbi:MAG: hypothetical protein LBQ79_10570 [Deltaproteobacteria bacterium]|jgi:hypothetical protein|nr:hypothetical protein [Deltaproteobacteria bacterium]